MKKLFVIITTIILLAPLFATAQSTACDAGGTPGVLSNGVCRAYASPTTPTTNGSGASNPQSANTSVQTTPNDRVSQGFSALGTTNTTNTNTTNPSTPSNTACPNGGTVGANGACNLGYTPLEPIPGVTSANGSYNPTQPGAFAAIINAIFRVLITVGALLAVFSLTIGGVQYMVTGSTALKSRAISRVKAALWGIALIAGIWLILNTLNPQLLNFNFNPCSAGNSTVCNYSSINTFTQTNGFGNSNVTSNSDLGIASNVNNLVNNINNDTPNPSECAAAQAGMGVKSPNDPGIVANLGNSLSRGASYAYYLGKAVFWDTDVTNTATPITDMINAGSTAWNQISTAETNFISKCQTAGY